MSVRSLQGLVHDVAEGLQAVHDVQIVHRDIQPKNLFWAESGDGGCWKLLDFGIARRLGSTTLTQEEIMGTPGYMSPEQALGRAIDHRSDLFSFAAVIYRALLGRPPYWGPSPLLTVHEIAMGRPQDPRQLDPSISPDLESFLLIALAHEPEDRFQTVGELHRNFASALDSRLSVDVRAQAQQLLFERGWADPDSELQTMRLRVEDTPGQHNRGPQASTELRQEKQL